MKLVVIIPAYNEEKTIAQVIREIPRNIEEINEVEVLVIDDGSTDNTVKEAKSAGAMVVSRTKNEGLGISFSTGIREALRQEADIIVNIDADNQFDSNDIPKLIKPILENRADMVTGARFKEGKIIPNMSELKRRGNKFFVWLVNLMTGNKFTDVSCGFRAYSRNTALYLNLFGRFTYTQEVFLDLVNKNKRIEEVPIKVTYYPKRDSKISGSLFHYGVRALGIVLRTFRDFHPLKFFGIPGVTIFGAGIIFWLYSFIYWLVYHQTTSIRMYFFVGTGLLIFGFLLIILALIADMLKKIRQNQEEILYKLKKKEYEK